MAILVFAGVLSVPSAVFAEANWYASLRAGVESSGGNIAIKDGASRWGIRGSAEAGEGLTAVYRFEHKINTPDAGQPGGRLSYVGLSGGFGTVTVGQIWNAAYNSVGAITDNAWYYGDSQTGYRHGNAVSYAFSNDLMALQVDAIYGAPAEVVLADDGATPPVTTGSMMTNNLQKVEFGLSVNVSDLGKVALAHIKKDHDGVADAGDLNDADGTAVNAKSSWASKTTLIAAEVSVAGMRAYVGTGNVKYTNTSPATLNDGSTDFAGADAVKPSEKTTFFGFSGSIGDTGASYLFQWRDVKKNNAKPWVLSLTKSLGDSASLVLEHANNKGLMNDDGSMKENQTQLGLVVSF